MTLTILVTLTLRAVHPPAISTALTFAFRPGDTEKWGIFMAALAIVCVLIVLQPVSARLLAHIVRRRSLRRT